MSVLKFDLLSVLRALYASEINCGLESFWDGGFTLWLGDNMNGYAWEKTIDETDMPKAGEILALAAVDHAPKSEFVKNYLGFGKELVDENVGWRGENPSHIDVFKCEFCGAENLDCTLIPHAKTCFVTAARQASRASK